MLLIPFVFLVLVSLFDRLLDDGIEFPRAGFSRPAVYGIVLALGVFLPLTRLPVALQRDSGFQRHTVELGHWLVKPEETYIDGINLLYRREQKVGALSWLGAPALRRLNGMTDAELQEIIEEMERQPVKLVVFNYRIEDLPQGLLMYLVPNFDHLWGNIMIYAPSIGPDDGQFAVKFSGHYRLETSGSEPIRIDGRQVAGGETLLLDKGWHQVAGDTLFRLVLAPEGIEEKADPRYRQENRLFFRPYEY